MRRFRFRLSLVLAAVIAPALVPAAAQHTHDDHGGMQFDSRGMVMNHNPDVLPRGCDVISSDVSFTVHAGTDHALGEMGRIFGYSQHDFRAPPCSRVTIHFHNDDQVRHQWMLHGLPRYLYPQGMFHLEAAGGQHVMGSFIVPADDATYLVHCDMAQHMEKGMKAQLVVGKGSTDLWSVPGVTTDFNSATGDKMPRGTIMLLLASVLTGAAMMSAPRR